MNRTHTTLTALVVALAAGATAAQASTAPEVFRQASHQFERKVYGYAKIQRDANGMPVLKVDFSHSKKFRGERGLGMTAYLKAGNETVAVVAVDRILSDPTFKGTREVHVLKALPISPEVWSKVTNVTYEFRAFMTPAQFATLQDKFQRPALEAIKPGAPNFPTGLPPVGPVILRF
jgi:hypothetical protein